MRIIEPTRRHKQRSFKKVFGVLLAVFVIGIVSFGGYVYFTDKQDPTSNQQSVLAANGSLPEPKRYTGTEEFRYFSGEDFLKLYESLSYPNTEPLREPPYITGNLAADKRIRTIAESRGYALRSVPVFNIQKTNEPRVTNDDLLQEKALAAWQALDAAAEKEGIPLELNSGYRSIEMQRDIFISRLRATGATDSQIAAGRADAQVVSTLKMTALPGYSRHHTGYTIDLVCGSGTQEFEVTTCFKWLSKDNYLNAKKNGWIPSYPEGTDNQGPEPEPWEYVWVGQEALIK